jgi:hypothetical protein
VRVYIFGAGASKGAQLADLIPERVAPLMDELFSPRYRRFALEVGLEGLTRWLVGLTVSLVVLTIVLAVLTGVLAYDVARRLIGN